MDGNFEFQRRNETITIEDKTFSLAPRSKEVADKLEEIAKEFNRPKQSFQTIIKTAHKAIDVFLGEGAFEQLFISEEKADIDDIIDLYCFLTQKYRNINTQSINKATAIKSKNRSKNKKKK